MEKKITIIIVNYKSLIPEYFQKSLSSAIAQTFNSYKIDVYLDSIECDCYNFNDVTIHKVPKEIQNKPVKIREYCIKNTDTEYIAFWDSDDVFNANKLDVLYQLAYKNKSELCFSNLGFFNDSGIQNDNYFNIIGFNKRKINIIDENYAGLGTTIIKTKYLKSLLPFPDISRLDWWIMIKSTHNNINISYTSEILIYYRIYEGSLSSLTKKLSVDDFIAEVNAKLEIYKSLVSDFLELKDRIDFYENLNINRDFEEIKEKYMNKKFKNIWGGLIDYEKQ